MSTGRVRQKDRAASGAVHIRWMIRRDMPEVMKAERASFEYSWTEDDFLRCLRQRNCIGMVAEQEASVQGTHGTPEASVQGTRSLQKEAIAGFMIYELHKTRLHVLNFAVHPSHRRQGIGGLMVNKLIYKLTSHRRQKITLAVRERNIVAQMFFRAHGFQATRLLRDYYEDSGEDAYQMELQAPEYDPFDGFGVIGPVNRIAQFEEN